MQVPAHIVSAFESLYFSDKSAKDFECLGSDIAVLMNQAAQEAEIECWQEGIALSADPHSKLGLWHRAACKIMASTEFKEKGLPAGDWAFFRLMKSVEGIYPKIYEMVGPAVPHFFGKSFDDDVSNLTVLDDSVWDWD